MTQENTHTNDFLKADKPLTINLAAEEPIKHQIEAQTPPLQP
jgi:hypothetical protein